MSPTFATWLARLLIRSKKSSVAAAMREEWAIPGHLENESEVDRELSRIGIFRCHICGVSYLGRARTHIASASIGLVPVCSPCSEVPSC